MPRVKIPHSNSNKGRKRIGRVGISRNNSKLKLPKEVKQMNAIVETPKMTCLTDIKKMIQDSMKEKGITPEQAIKSIGIKRYIKNYEKKV